MSFSKEVPEGKYEPRQSEVRLTYSFPNKGHFWKVNHPPSLPLAHITDGEVKAQSQDRCPHRYTGVRGKARIWVQFIPSAVRDWRPQRHTQGTPLGPLRACPVPCCLRLPSTSDTQNSPVCF